MDSRDDTLAAPEGDAEKLERGPAGIGVLRTGRASEGVSDARDEARNSWAGGVRQGVPRFLSSPLDLCDATKFPGEG